MPAKLQNCTEYKPIFSKDFKTVTFLLGEDYDICTVDCESLEILQHHKFADIGEKQGGKYKFKMLWGTHAIFRDDDSEICLLNLQTKKIITVENPNDMIEEIMEFCELK